MIRQSNQKVRELHKVKINSGLTAKKLKVSKCYRCYSSLLSTSFKRGLWLCESFSHLQNLRRDHQSHTLESNNKSTISVLVGQFWSISDAFWWPALSLPLELLSVAFILNVCGSFIGLRTSFELFPFLYQLRDEIAFKKLKNVIDQLWLLRGRGLRYNSGLDDGRRQTILYRGACSRLVTHRNEMK